MPIYRDGNSFSDRGGGLDITDTIGRLLPKKRGKGRLDAPPSRDALPASVAEELPSASEVDAGGIASPLTEVAPSVSTTWSLYSSDGLFVYTFYRQTDYEDANGDPVTIVHRDPNA